MKVLIIEDEAPAFRRLQRILEEIDASIEIIDVLDSVEQSIHWFQSNTHPDLVFMDIQLADGLSLEIFDAVQLELPVIFTTAYDEYALKAFKVNSIDYLLKPIEKSLLEKSLEKFNKVNATTQNYPDLKSILQHIQPEAATYKKRYLVKRRGKLLPIQTRDIAYFYTDNGIVYLIHQDGEKYAFDRPLDQIENQMDPQQFFRLNRQFLINVSSVKSTIAYDKGKLIVEVEPTISTAITVSRERASSFKRWLDDEN